MKRRQEDLERKKEEPPSAKPDIKRDDVFTATAETMRPKAGKEKRARTPDAIMQVLYKQRRSKATEVHKCSSLKNCALDLTFVFQHNAATIYMPTSHRKLKLLSKQISGKPIDYAILQMQFSEKRVSGRIQEMLLKAKEGATKDKKMDASRLIVCELHIWLLAVLIVNGIHFSGIMGEQRADT
jgi:hypothetical protein